MLHPSITGGPITPRTALNDDIGNVSTMILGTVLIIAGYYLFRKKRSYDLQR
jgi:LPXTG-motif cell wall-anchored protein